MGRQPCCDKVGLKKGPWTADEDKKLINFILTNGQCCWRAVPKLAGLLRCGKSCRLRWTNYLRPDLKRGLLSDDEEKLVIDLHAQLGNRWSKIASHLLGRTDNEIKNHWNTHIKKKLKKMGIDPQTHKPIIETDKPQAESSMAESSETSQNKQEHEQEQEPVNGFCTDEVPLIQPHEIIIPCTSSTSSSSYSSASTSNNFLEDLQLPDFEWMSNNLNFWEDDFNMWDVLLNEDGDYRNPVDPSVNQYQRMLADQEAWNNGFFCE